MVGFRKHLPPCRLAATFVHHLGTPLYTSRHTHKNGHSPPPLREGCPSQPSSPPLLRPSQPSLSGGPHSPPLLREGCPSVWEWPGRTTRRQEHRSACTHHLVAASHKNGDSLGVGAALHYQHLVLGGAKADLQVCARDCGFTRVVALSKRDCSPKTRTIQM